MKKLNISVANKVATYSQRDGVIVCGNSDYQITFSFDSEWSAYTEKIARFKWNGDFKDVPFEGNVVNVPKITNATQVSIGVYAGDLRTTTPAEITCVKSILCGDEVELITEEDKQSLIASIAELEDRVTWIDISKCLYLNSVKINFCYDKNGSTVSELPRGSVTFKYLGTGSNLERSFGTATPVLRLYYAFMQSVGLDYYYTRSEVTIGNDTYPIRAFAVKSNNSSYIDLTIERWGAIVGYESKRLECYQNNYYLEGTNTTTNGAYLKLNVTEIGSKIIFL